MVAFRDVGERRRTEAVLRERDAILSALGQPVYVGTPDGLITYANPAAVEILGYGDASELIGQNGHWLIHYKRRDGSHYPLEECPLTRGRDTGNLVRIEEDWLVRKDGSMMPVACTAVPFEAPGGYGIAVSFTDLSIRLAAERAAREREIAEARAAELSAGEARHRAILAAALDGVVIIDRDGRVTYLNAAPSASSDSAPARFSAVSWPKRSCRHRCGRPTGAGSPGTWRPGRHVSWTGGSRSRPCARTGASSPPS